jgi:hypothetical protein
MCSALVEDLKQYDFTGSPPLPSVAHHKGGPVTALSTLLDQAMDEIFMPFLEGQRYVDLEIKNLSEGYQSLLSKFTRCHVSVSINVRLTASDRRCYPGIRHQVQIEHSARPSCQSVDNFDCGRESFCCHNFFCRFRRFSCCCLAEQVQRTKGDDTGSWQRVWHGHASTCAGGSV